MEGPDPVLQIQKEMNYICLCTHLFSSCFSGYGKITCIVHVCPAVTRLISAFVTAVMNCLSSVAAVCTAEPGA